MWGKRWVTFNLNEDTKGEKKRLEEEASKSLS